MGWDPRTDARGVPKDDSDRFGPFCNRVIDRENRHIDIRDSRFESNDRLGFLVINIFLSRRVGQNIEGDLQRWQWIGSFDTEVPRRSGLDGRLKLGDPDDLTGPKEVILYGDPREIRNWGNCKGRLPGKSARSLG